MPEGIDDAARAFQTEIAPGSTRPRDDSGRFLGAQRPEHLFQERATEGEPPTDTREDQRLAEIERRVADGRSQEGDADRLEGYAARSGEAAARQGGPRRERVPAGDEGARHAGADERHDGAETEQGRGDDEPEQHDQDGEGPDARDGAEGTSEQDAESQFKVTTLDGKPVEKFEVTVDGRPLEVSLDEALAGYIKEATFKTRLNKVHEARQAVEAEASQVSQWRDMYAQRLQQLDQELAELTPQEPDWDKEFAANPAKARADQKAFQAIYGKRQEIARRQQQAADEARQVNDQRVQRYAVQQFGEFVSEANYRDEKALQSELSIIRSYLRKRGFSEAEAATVYDKRMLHVARDAALYDQANSTKPKPVRPGQGKALIPGTASPVGQAGRRHIDDAQNRLAKTGRLEDAAAVMSRLIR
jgi:hypothetical protein